METLVYKWSPLLIVKEPVDTVHMWLDKSALKPTLLLPSLLRYCAELDRIQLGSSSSTEILHTGENVAIKYLRHYFDRIQQLAREEPRSTANGGLDINHANLVVRSPAEASLYQAYLWMLAKYDQSNEAQLISALKLEVDVVTTQLPLSPELKNKFVDYDFVLRQCQKYGRKKSQVYVYHFLGLAEESLQLALSLDVSLAKVSLFLPIYLSVYLPVIYMYIHKYTYTYIHR